MMMDAPVAVVCGHYGVGKTNLTLNIALDAAAGGRAVTVIDLDVVNPFFRSSDYRALLDERGIRLVAPVFAGTNVDGPSLSGTIEPAIDGAQRAWRDGDERPFVVIDAGGDDAGATALGRFARTVEQAPYEMLYVVNRNRNLTQEPAEAVEVLREIEAKSHLRATCVVNNTHLQHDTDAQVVEQGLPFAQAPVRPFMHSDETRKADHGENQRRRLLLQGVRPVRRRVPRADHGARPRQDHREGLPSRVLHRPGRVHGMHVLRGHVP